MSTFKKKQENEVNSLIEKLYKDHPDRIPRFLYWLLTDPKYGAINPLKNENQIKENQGIIDLFEEWINTGVKPEEEEMWRNASNLVFDDDYSAASTIAYAAAFTSLANIIDVSYEVRNQNSISKEESYQAQIDKLNELKST